MKSKNKKKKKLKREITFDNNNKYIILFLCSISV